MEINLTPQPYLKYPYISKGYSRDSCLSCGIVAAMTQPQTPLALLPVSTVAFALGVSTQRKGRPPGQVAALCDELRRRGVWPDMLAALDPQLRRSLEILDTMDRGQAWNQGRRPRR